jgi:hypothetical protein
MNVPNETADSASPKPVDAELTFHVHLFAVVRVTIPGINSTSMHAAVPAAIDAFCASESPKRFEGESTGFADEFSHFLVDVEGDPEFEQSRFLTSGQEPLLELLERLVAWDESGRPEPPLAAILAEVRSILKWSV